MFTLLSVAKLTGRTWHTVHDAFERLGVKPAITTGRWPLYDAGDVMKALMAWASGESGRPDLTAERARLCQLQQKDLENKLAEADGTLVRRDDVEDLFGTALSSFRSRALELPVTLAPMLLALDDPATAESIIRPAIEQLLRDLHANLSRYLEPASAS